MENTKLDFAYCKSLVRREKSWECVNSSELTTRSGTEMEEDHGSIPMHQKQIK
jgi:hypothetical protein